MKYHCTVPGFTYSCPDTGRECAGLVVEADSVDEARAKALEKCGITGGISLGDVICQAVAEAFPVGRLVASVPIEHTEPVELKEEPAPEEATGTGPVEPSLWSVPTSPDDPPAPVAMGPAPVDLE